MARTRGEEVFKALRNEPGHTPLWMLFRQGFKVRGLEFRLFYPKPRSAASAAAAKYAENRITFRLRCSGGPSRAATRSMPYDDVSANPETCGNEGIAARIAA
jgi:hypothetical protein